MIVSFLREYEAKMTAYHGPYGTGGSGADPPGWPIEYGQWELVPKWNWHRLFGYDIRHPVYDHTFHNGKWWWKYGRSRAVARNLLRNEHEPRRVDAWGNVR